MLLYDMGDNIFLAAFFGEAMSMDFWTFANSHVEATWYMDSG